MITNVLGGVTGRRRPEVLVERHSYRIGDFLGRGMDVEGQRVAMVIAEVPVPA